MIIPLEDGVFLWLAGGFIAFMCISFLVIAILWLRYPIIRAPLNCLLVHYVFFSIAGYLLLDILTINPFAPMASEEISLHLAAAGVVWGASMICQWHSIRVLVKHLAK